MVGNDKAHCIYTLLILAVLLLPYPYTAMPYSGTLNTQCVQVQNILISDSDQVVPSTLVIKDIATENQL